jgi:tRNA A37 threonylcarbamoyltransferase TsaD
MGTTIDDSLGEAFDKVARLLGITAVPGGCERVRDSVMWWNVRE